MVRGDVVRLAPPRRTHGHEQQGGRPGVVVQAEQLLELSTVIVAPTSRSAAPATFRPMIDLAGTETRVLTDQLRAVDAQAVRSTLGRLSPDEMAALDEALMLVFGLRAV
jgi:mRNA interferase MazF